MLQNQLRAQGVPGAGSKSSGLGWDPELCISASGTDAIGLPSSTCLETRASKSQEPWPISLQFIDKGGDPRVARDSHRTTQLGQGQDCHHLDDPALDPDSDLLSPTREGGSGCGSSHSWGFANPISSTLDEGACMAQGDEKGPGAHPGSLREARVSSQTQLGFSEAPDFRALRLQSFSVISPAHPSYSVGNSNRALLFLFSVSVLNWFKISSQIGRILLFLFL